MDNGSIANGGIELLHALPGRIRLRVPGVKANPQRRDELQKQLAGLKVVQEAKVSPTTGSVLILYDPTDAGAMTELASRFGPALDLVALSNRVAATPEVDASGPGPAEGVADWFRGVNTQVRAATGGLDLKFLVPLTLFLLGIGALLFAKKFVAPKWYNFLWFAFATFCTLNRALVARGAAPDGVPELARPQAGAA